ARFAVLTRPFCFDGITALLAIHSFPTRRSSDLARAGRDDHRRGPSHERERRHPVPRFVATGDRRRGDQQPHGRRRDRRDLALAEDRKSTRLNSSHQIISYAVFCLKKKKEIETLE